MGFPLPGAPLSRVDTSGVRVLCYPKDREGGASVSHTWGAAEQGGHERGASALLALLHKEPACKRKPSIDYNQFNCQVFVGHPKQETDCQHSCWPANTTWRKR